MDSYLDLLDLLFHIFIYLFTVTFSQVPCSTKYITLLLFCVLIQNWMFYLPSASFVIFSCALLPKQYVEDIITQCLFSVVSRLYSSVQEMHTDHIPAVRYAALCWDYIIFNGFTDVSRAPPLSYNKYPFCDCVSLWLSVWDEGRTITLLPFNHSTVKKSKRMRKIFPSLAFCSIDALKMHNPRVPFFLLEVNFVNVLLNSNCTCNGKQVVNNVCICVLCFFWFFCPFISL